MQMSACQPVSLSLIGRVAESKQNPPHRLHSPTLHSPLSTPWNINFAILQTRKVILAERLPPVFQLYNTNWQLGLFLVLVACISLNLNYPVPSLL